MEKKVVEFHVNFEQVLDENGQMDESLRNGVSDEFLKKMLLAMVRARAFDEKMLKLQRSGRLGTFAPVLGQEAQVGVAFAMQKDDFLIQNFRENAATIVFGQTMKNILLNYGGDERGNHMPDGVNVLPVSIPVGSQPLHAAGIAWGMKLRKKPFAAVSFCGDGATSEGETLEAMNFAGDLKLPVVFVVQNNQFAISTPRKKQTGAPTIAQKAIAFGFDGIQVDGNDVVAVYNVAKAALEKAYRGEGPTLIEMLTYRMGDHTTADDWTRYRAKEEVEYWKARDPIERVKKYLRIKGQWSDAEDGKSLADATAEVEAAVKEYESIEKPKPADMFDFVYARPGEEFAKERAEAILHVEKLEKEGES